MKFISVLPVALFCLAFSITPNIYAQNLNISFLLDLSDRISPQKYPDEAMPYHKRDLEYIKSVEKAFMQHIRSKKVMKLNDQMQVFFDPAPANPAINAISQSLKVKIDKTTSKASLNLVDKTFTTIPPKIYLSAIKTRRYVGSDIYNFFQKKVKNYCIEANHRNILVILTDGYMYHLNSKFVSGNMSSYITPAFIRAKKLNTINFEANMQKHKIGFIPATTGLKDLEVIVIGINPAKGNPFEEEVINKYWADWFKAMGVRSYHLFGADLPANIDPILQKIIGKLYQII